MARHGYKRADRVAKSLSRVVAQAIQSEISDPALRLAVITRTRLSPDLSYAWVYWHLLGDASEAEIEGASEGFERAAGAIRRIVGRALRMRVTPELRFEYDASLDEARRIDALLAKVARETAPSRSDGDADSEERPDAS